MSQLCYLLVLLLVVGCTASTDFDTTEDFDSHDINDEPAPSPPPEEVTRTTVKPPLKCYHCISRSDQPSQSCLNPNKNSTNIATCVNGNKCFLSRNSNIASNETIQRGCKANCEPTTFNSCCEEDLCNDKSVMHPNTFGARRALPVKPNKSDKPLPQTVLFFVTVLLLLQTVVKVAIV